MSIQMIDMILLVISVLILVQAYKNGLIFSVLKLIGWGLAAYTSIQYATSFSLPAISPFWVFIATGALSSLGCRMLRKLLHTFKILGFFDHLLGLGAGLIEVYLFLWIVFHVMTILPISIDLQQSMLYPYMQEVETYVPYSISI